MSKGKCWNCKKREGVLPIYECENEIEHWVCGECMEQLFEKDDNLEVTPDNKIVDSMASTIRCLEQQLIQKEKQLNDFRKKYGLL